MSDTLRARLEAGDVALGVLDNTYSPAVVELCGELGVDFVWLDLEHGGPSPWDAQAVEGFARAAERSGTELLVRVPTADPALVRKVLDTGVRNVFLSRVESATEVQRAVRASRFTIEGDPGERGLASPRARRWGQREGYVDREDREAMVGVTIENRAAVADLEAILDVPELGFVFVGPLDLSVSVGHPGELTHPDVAAAEDRVLEAALDANVPVGGLGFGMDDVNSKADAGYQLLNLGSTTGALTAAVEGWVSAYDGPGRGGN
ncbi:aldolase/citrate lyase family protein [Salinirubellus salinus]|uniref:Aldolase/citrate lyase family protein n=1 Tax=Salinirubellus salinus TaxID=1364945 RepID=A0A9E7R441_9EURY|nr:aldolase/citrate lyase family protein [Salinirubellus salinus]UWM55491.1 aldolase/citrate lyase family protein [Salinirubellus salinus]